ncbi:hypothetical protein BH09BAC5_BH09BAC5_23030 [soil metagenome]
MAHHEDDERESPDLTQVIEKVNEHVDTRMKYFRLVISEKIAMLFSSMGTIGIVLILFLLFFLFTNVAAALLIGKYFENYALGFGLMSLFYLLLAIIYLLFRKSVFEPKIQDSVINALYPENDEEDEDDE